MPQQTWQRNLGDALEAAVREQAGRDHYARSQMLGTGGGTDRAGRAHPLEFDESGFPVPQTKHGFTTRVARLLSRF
jgi:hypothetical protein